MTRLAYPARSLLGDYLRAAVVLGPIAAILATMRVTVVVAVLLIGGAALFLVFGIRTALRHATRLELSEDVLRAAGPFARSIVWSELDGIKLSYYSTRRDRGGGWMQLELRAGRSVLRLDSRIEGFALLIERAARAAAARRLPLDAATATNLRSLGIGAPAILETRRGAA
jgi:uncharacterized membrane protein YbhN (UPF0104 family)